MKWGSLVSSKAILFNERLVLFCYQTVTYLMVTNRKHMMYFKKRITYLFTWSSHDWMEWKERRWDCHLLYASNRASVLTTVVTWIDLLSGGVDGKETTRNLNLFYPVPGTESAPWKFNLSYGRASQTGNSKTWDCEQLAITLYLELMTESISLPHVQRTCKKKLQEKDGKLSKRLESHNMLVTRLNHSSLGKQEREAKQKR